MEELLCPELVLVGSLEGNGAVGSGGGRGIAACGEAWGTGVGEVSCGEDGAAAVGACCDDGGIKHVGAVRLGRSN